jgi:hypothetical protein
MQCSKTGGQNKLRSLNVVKIETNQDGLSMYLLGPECQDNH